MLREKLVQRYACFEYEVAHSSTEVHHDWN